MDSSTTWKKRKHDAGRVYAGMCSIEPDALHELIVDLAVIFWPDVGDVWTYNNYRPVWTLEGSYMTVYADRRKTDGSGVSITPVDVVSIAIDDTAAGRWLEVHYSYDAMFANAIVGQLQADGWIVDAV